MKTDVHDNHLVGYQVWADKPEIRLHPVDPFLTPPEETDIIFSGVVGYHFEGDDFQNIIFEVGEIDAQTIYDQNRATFEDGQKHCWPGVWNKSGQSVLAYLAEYGIILARLRIAQPGCAT